MTTQSTPLSLSETKQVNGGSLRTSYIQSRSRSSNDLNLRKIEHGVTQALKETGGQFNLID